MWCGYSNPLPQNPLPPPMAPLGSNKYLDKEVQTIIRVYPHILESNKIKAHVICESKCQTEVSIAPEEEDKFYYSMLEYVPFQDIQETCIRVIDLPRKLRLHFSSAVKFDILDYNLFLDDDGINELCLDLKERAQLSTCRLEKKYKEMETQTEEMKK